MTTPEAVLAPSFAGAGLADTAHADLVARLANEIYRQGNTAASPLMPQQAPPVPQIPTSPSLVAPNPHGAPSLPGVPTFGGDFGNASTLSHLGTRSFGAPVGLPGITGSAAFDTTMAPSEPARPASAPNLSRRRISSRRTPRASHPATLRPFPAARSATRARDRV